MAKFTAKAKVPAAESAPARTSESPATVSPVRRTRMSREARSAQLLDVAEELFCAYGFERTSIEDVAKAAGVTRPVVYAHYSDKDKLFLACVRRARAEVEESLVEFEAMIRTGADVATVLDCAGAIFFTTLERNPRRWMVLFNPSTALSEDLDKQLNALRRKTIEQIASVTRHVLPDNKDRSNAFAYAISGVGEQIGRWWLDNPEIPRDDVITYYREFIERGLGILPPST
ncbi:TetR/AcrR family transcriptional regulator [Burkholderia cepacia]|uniref:TetR/AcrR family transcriptional regulator n=1 Tax=Burkholderia cepacia TaxID=292 RepID=UPI000F5980CD|nr:TetR/AcrR family transcriptional regulator [Burkholderia cepacia]RQT41402.1 TetR/AcrR family transcriptional regulator [Burkholderia cepacia]